MGRTVATGTEIEGWDAIHVEEVTGFWTIHQVAANNYVKVANHKQVNHDVYVKHFITTCWNDDTVGHKINE